MSNDNNEQSLIELTDDDEILDETADDQEIAAVRYDISAYGIDFDVKGLVERLNQDKVRIPDFQRSYVWSLPDASRFIESLLLGLPVPGIFLGRDPQTNKLLVIDGQQRLKSLQFFFSGVFNPDPEKSSQRVFKLSSVQKRFEGATYESLDEPDRQALEDSVIHATIVKQDAPADDDTSLYHVYERLNSGGRRLVSQEIRAAVYHGQLLDALRDMNALPEWRKLFGKVATRLKDQEMILRFFAFYFEEAKYRRPLSEFLNTYAQRHRNPGNEYIDLAASIFAGTMRSVIESLGESAFRPERAFNAAVFDSVAVGLARRLAVGPPPDPAAMHLAYRSFIGDPAYVEATSRSTADQQFVERRMKIARDAFAGLP